MIVRAAVGVILVLLGFVLGATVARCPDRNIFSETGFDTVREIALAIRTGTCEGRRAIIQVDGDEIGIICEPTE